LFTATLEEKMKHSIVTLTRSGLFLAAFVFALGSSALATNWIVTMGDDDRFHPDSLAVALGDSVTWVNEDADPHTSTSGPDCTPDGDWDSGTMNPGDTFTYVTDEEGTIPYYCTFHCIMGMVGVLVVGDPTPAEERTWGKIKAIYREAGLPR
jgi:plastocyanin